MPETQPAKIPIHIRLSWIFIAVIVIAAAVYLKVHHTVLGIRAEAAARQNLVSTISTNGKVEPVNNFEAHAPGPSSVRQVLAVEGQQVHKGQLLVRLDDAEARSSAARAEAQLKAAQAENTAIEDGGTREEMLSTQSQIDKALMQKTQAQQSIATLRRLQQSGAASAGEVQAAQAKLDGANADLQLLQQKQKQRFAPQDVQRTAAAVAQAQSALSAAQDQIRQTNIIAPLDGTVYQIPVKVGAFVQSGDLLVQVADLAHMQVRAFVDEPDIGKLAYGQPVTVSWDALPGFLWQGLVKAVPQTVITRGTRTVGEVLCSVENSQNGDKKLLPNVNVNVSIQTARKDNVLTVPREAVHQDKSGRFVLVVRDGRLRKAYVQTGIASLTRVEVISGASEGDMIAINSASGEALNEGQYVKLLQ